MALNAFFIVLYLNKYQLQFILSFNRWSCRGLGKLESSYRLLKEHSEVSSFNFILFKNRIHKSVYIENREGLQTKEINLYADDIPQSQIEPILKIRILVDYKISHRLIYWDKDVECTAKEAMPNINNPNLVFKI